VDALRSHLAAAAVDAPAVATVRPPSPLPVERTVARQQEKPSRGDQLPRAHGAVQHSRLFRGRPETRRARGARGDGSAGAGASVLFAVATDDDAYLLEGDHAEVERETKRRKELEEQLWDEAEDMVESDAGDKAESDAEDMVESDAEDVESDAEMHSGDDDDN
jgi:hypothetical protein